MTAKSTVSGSLFCMSGRYTLRCVYYNATHHLESYRSEMPGKPLLGHWPCQMLNLTMSVKRVVLVQLDLMGGGKLLKYVDIKRCIVYIWSMFVSLRNSLIPVPFKLWPVTPNEHSSASDTYLQTSGDQMSLAVHFWWASPFLVWWHLHSGLELNKGSI